MAPRSSECALTPTPRPLRRRGAIPDPSPAYREKVPEDPAPAMAGGGGGRAAQPRKNDSMTNSTRQAKLRWFVPGDLNGFFGLVVDNLSILGFIAAALVGIFAMPADVVFQRMFPGTALGVLVGNLRSEEHTSELQSLMRISYAVFCLKKKTKHNT